MTELRRGREGCRFRRPYVAGGAPYLSLKELVDFDDSYFAFGSLGEQRGMAHNAKLRESFSGSSEEDRKATVELARKRWQSWLDSKPSVGKERRFETSLGVGKDKLESLARLRELLSASGRARARGD